MKPASSKQRRAGAGAQAISKKGNGPEALELRPGQSIALLKALHILTRDGRINQDSRRKLKQVNHLLQFIAPLIEETLAASSEQTTLSIVDHGAGKSYLGFMIYDRFFAAQSPAAGRGEVHSIETRAELVEQARRLAAETGFSGMRFHVLSVADSIASAALPEKVDIVTALHACNTATDDAIRFALARHARHVVLVPCCQAEVASMFRATKADTMRATPLAELWRHPLHTREFGSQITNVLRCLQLEAHGYQVTVTELVGWEHSLKNELILATARHALDSAPAKKAAARLNALLESFGLAALATRFQPMTDRQQPANR